MPLIIKNKAIQKIRRFYCNVAKKYSNTYSIELLLKNINNARNAIFEIENGLLRQKPTISRWKGLYMATSRDRKWNFAYRIEDDTIYVEDACHAQNMHESKHIVKLTKTELREIIKNSVRTILNEHICKRKKGGSGVSVRALN